MQLPPEPLQQAAIALGSNLGASRANLEGALAALDQSAGVRVLARSSWYRSAPIGPVQPDYLNGCAVLEVSLPPEALLDLLLATEQRYGRVRAERWGPRTLDLALIFYGQLLLDSERLQLPHPRMAERGFVLLPLAEIAAEWLDPVSGRSVRQLAAALVDPGDVQRLEEPC
jgi:2-amino-4-hydroxy-6-hydroxymethyldihydropteridine diphosphokinase